MEINKINKTCINLAQKIVKSSKELEKKNKELEDLSIVIRRRRILETTIEGQPQSFIKIICFLLSITSTKSVTGIEAFFDVDVSSYGIPASLLD